MTWRGPLLSQEQEDVRSAMDAVIKSLPPVLTDTPEDVSAVVGELAELGFWALGAEESVGGGGADSATTLIALERIGRAWPALGWSSVQAHAALRVLTSAAQMAGLAESVSAGTEAIAVVDGASDHVHLGWDRERFVGSVPRIDASHPAPHLLILTGPADAVLVAPGGLSVVPRRRTGLDGALTRSVEISATDVVELSGVDVPGVRSILRRGAAAVASGIAGAAADAALAYAAERRQFGDALIALPTVRQALLRQAARAAVAINAVLAAPDDEVVTLAVLTEACDAAVEVSAAAIQSHGGYGYLAEYGVERLLRDAVSLRAATDLLGSSAPVARALVGQPDLERR